MMTLAMKKLAADYPGTAFVHAFPGIVNTPLLTRGSSALLSSLFKWVILPVLSLFVLSADEAGERQFFHGTSARYPAANRTPSSDGDTLDGPAVAKGLDGIVGSGMYTLDWNGESVINKVVKQLEDRGTADAVWKHTIDTFEKMAR